MVLIGIMGRIGSGKTLGSDYIANKHNFIEKSFADSLKKACSELFMLSNAQLNGTQLQKLTPDPRWYNCTPRQMMQYVGTDLLRNCLDVIMPGIGGDVFVNNVRIWYTDLKKHDPLANVVISDVRFQNEVDFIHSVGGFVIKIVRSDIDENNSVINNHASETGAENILNYDYLITNDSTIEEYYKKIDQILTEIVN